MGKMDGRRDERLHAAAGAAGAGIYPIFDPVIDDPQLILHHVDMSQLLIECLRRRLLTRARPAKARRVDSGSMGARAQGARSSCEQLQARRVRRGEHLHAA